MYRLSHDNTICTQHRCHDLCQSTVGGPSHALDINTDIGLSIHTCICTLIMLQLVHPSQMRNNSRLHLHSNIVYMEWIEVRVEIVAHNKRYSLPWSPSFRGWVTQTFTQHTINVQTQMQSTVLNNILIICTGRSNEHLLDYTCTFTHIDF